MLAFLLVLLLFATPVQAGMVIGSGTAGAPDHCPSCFTDDADILCEDFENGGTGPVCAGWTTVDNGAGTVTYEAHPAGIPGCTDEGSYAAKIVHTASDDDCYIYYDAGTTREALYIQGWFYLESEGMADGGRVPIITIGTGFGGTSVRARLWIEQVAGVGLRLTADVYNGSTYDFTDGTTVLSTGTWYRIIFAFDGGDFMRAWLNEDADASPEIEDVADITTVDVQYVSFGGYEAGEEAYTFWIDNIKIDATAAPGGCQ